MKRNEKNVTLTFLATYAYIIPSKYYMLAFMLA